MKGVISLKQFFLWMMSLISFLLPLGARADEIDYTIPSYQAELILFPDQLATFNQTITFKYDSYYRGQYITLGTAGDLPRGAAIVGTPEVVAYQNGSQVAVQVEEVTWADGRKLKIYNPGSPGDQVTLQIRWQLKNFLSIYDDIARLNWVPISDWDMPLERVDITVRTERASQKSQLAVHRGFFQPETIIGQTNDTTYRLTARDVGGQLHIHAYWDRGIVDSLPNENGAGLPRYQAVEQELADRQAQLSFRYERLFIGLVAAGLVLSLLVLVYFRRLVSGNSHFPRRVYEVPEDWAPLVVAQQIFNQSLLDSAPPQSVPGALSFDNMIQATLLDLIDRKHLAVSGAGDHAILSIQSSKGLSSFEKELLELAFGDQKSCSVRDLFTSNTYDKRLVEQLKRIYGGGQLEQQVRQLADTYLEYYQLGLARVTEGVEETIRELGLPSNYRPLSSRERGLFALGVGLAVASLGLALFSSFALITYGHASAVLTYLLLGGLSLPVLIWAGRLYRPYATFGVLTPEGKQGVEPWLGFWQMLKDIKSFDRVELDGVVVWNRMLVYATLFGQADKVEAYLRLHHISLPSETGLSLTHGHYNFLHHSVHQNLVTVAHQATSASHFTVSSGSSGISGGFSGGGGGGGGGSF